MSAVAAYNEREAGPANAELTRLLVMWQGSIDVLEAPMPGLVSPHSGFKLRSHESRRMDLMPAC